MKDIIFPITYKTDTKGLKDAESGLDRLGNFAKGAGIALGAAFVAAGAATVAFGVSALKAAAEAESVSRGLENAAKNAGVFGDQAGAIAKVTKELDKHSKSLGEMTGYDDELINQIKTGWLAVPALAAKGTAGINKLAEATADIAAGTGKDIQAVAMAFTKIAGDSETALSKLNRIGIVLSDQQKQAYEDILATNGEIAAQDYLIEQLGTKYEGAALAAANPFAQLDVIMGNLKETIGGALLPAFQAVVPQFQAFIDEMVTSPEFEQFLATIGTNFQTILSYLPGVVQNLWNFGKDALPAIKAFFPFINEALGLLGAIFFGIDESDPASSTNDFAGAMQRLAGSINTVTGALQTVRDVWNSLPPFLRNNFFQIVEHLAKNPFTGKASQWTQLFTGGGKDGNPFTPMANGGIVLPRPGGTLAQIGEAGQAEAVIPLDRLSSMIGGTGGGSVYNINVTAGMGTDGAAVGEQIVNAIRRYERTSGAVFARA